MEEKKKKKKKKNYICPAQRADEMGEKSNVLKAVGIWPHAYASSFSNQGSVSRANLYNHPPNKCLQDTTQ
jgi:hypothetical protein